MVKFTRYLAMCAAVLFLGVACNNDPDEPGPPSDSNWHYSLGEYAFNELNEGLSNYYLVISNIAMSGDIGEPVFSGGGEYLMLDIYAIAAEQLVLPEGTYTFFAQSEAIADKVFSGFSAYGKTDAEGKTVISEELKSGILKVSKSGDVYTIDVNVKTTENKTVKCVYVGKIDFVDVSGGNIDIFEPIGEDVFTSFVMSRGFYYGTTLSSKEQFKIELFDYLFEGSPDIGHTITIELLSKPMQGTTLPPPGTYAVGAKDVDEYDVVLPGWGDTKYLVDRGTRCLRMASDGGQGLKAYYTFATTGTVKIAVSGDEYTITVDLADDNGYKIQGEYKGDIEFKDKSYYTTITEDYEVTLTNAPCEVDYYGQWFQDVGVEGDNWGIYIGTNRDGAEMVQMELLAPHGPYANGIPVGEYTVSLDYSTGDYTCIPAELHDAGMYYSWYMGDFNGGVAFREAPFKAGKVTVAREGENYTFAFDVTDDYPGKPNRVTGTWTGKPKFTDKSGSVPKAPRAVRAAKSK